MIHTEVREKNVLWITIDDPEAMNALDGESLAELADTWRRFAADDSLRSAVLTGAGDRAFCVGANLKKLVPLISSGEMNPRDNQEAYIKGEIEPLDKPVLAAINGDCFGGGFELMLSTDIRVAVSNARFGLPEVNWGVFPAGGGSARLPRQVSRAQAMEILLTGEFFDAEHAKSIGLVNHVVEPGELEDRVLGLAKRIGRNGPFAVRRVKQSVLEGADETIERALEREIEIAEAVFASEEAEKGLAAFAEKRRPEF